MENSVLSQGVIVEEGASVSYSVLLPGVRVERGAQVRYAILGENCRVGAEARVGAAPEDCDPDAWGLAVLAPECDVAPGRKVKAGIMLNKRGEERAK